MKKIIIGTDENGMFSIRKLLTLLFIGFALAGTAQTATVKSADGTYQSVTKERAKTEAVSTGKVFQTKDGTKYPIFESKNGKFFIIRTSQKSGAKYNQYLNIQNEAQ